MLFLDQSAEAFGSWASLQRDPKIPGGKTTTSERLERNATKVMSDAAGAERSIGTEADSALNGTRELTDFIDTTNEVTGQK